MSRVAVGLCCLAVGASVFAAVFVGQAATRSFDPGGTIVFEGRRTFPIVLSPAPPHGSKTPWGTDALAETVSAGVNVFRVGSRNAWTAHDTISALAWDRAAAALHVHTWVNLSGYSQALPGSPLDARLAHAVRTLTSDPSGRAIALWKGRDEPWWSGVAASALKFAYCRVTSRGGSSSCDGETALDPAPLWVTVEAPRGTAADLAPYASVTDVHGVDIFPVKLANPSPDLHQVGQWTATLASTTPSDPVWTTLQICAGASYDHKTPGSFVLPTRQQERYMAYDAIINGAGALAFYGGNIRGCWRPRDAEFGWNWTFWQNVLRPLVEELSASSPIAPALVNAGTNRDVAKSDGTTEAVLRQGTSVDDLWLIAARSGPGSAEVTFSGLPPWARSGSVYTERRTVTASAGAFRDSFRQWDVHVYHFVEPLSLRTETPLSAPVGSHVTLRGQGLAAATAVSFAGVNAHFTISSDRTLVATVPRQARSGQIVVTSARSESASSFAILPSPAALPRIIGGPRVGSVLKATTGSWYGDPPTGYTFQWLRCDALGRRCSPLPHATQATLRLAPRRAGKRLRVLVVAHTPSGSAHARSAPTSLVTR